MFLIITLFSCNANSFDNTPSNTQISETIDTHNKNNKERNVVGKMFNENYILVYHFWNQVGKINPVNYSPITTIEDKAIYLNNLNTLEKTFNGQNIYYLNIYTNGATTYFDFPIYKYDYSWIKPFDEYATISGALGTAWIDNCESEFDININDILNGISDNKYLITEASIYDFVPESDEVLNYIARGAVAVKYKDSYLKEVLNGNVEPVYDGLYERARVNPEFIRVYHFYYLGDVRFYFEVILMPYENGTAIHMEVDIKEASKSGCSVTQTDKYPFLCEEYRKIYTYFDYFSDVNLSELAKQDF